MKTDRLIELLVADLKPVNHRRISYAIIIGLAVGMASAFVVMISIFIIPLDLMDRSNLQFLSVKLLFGSGIVATAAVLLPKLARPGTKLGSSIVITLMPFAAIAAAAIAALASAHSSSWVGMIVEEDSLICIPSIPLLAILPFLIIILTLRLGLPTDRIRAGAIAGLAAGGLGAFACAFPCTDQLLPSIALWYGFPIGICATVGGKLGPNLLRW
jgi:hypothetical protein